MIKRPSQCRAFICNWLMNDKVGDEWHPQRARMVLHHRIDNGKLIFNAVVDPSTPDVWQREPYYRYLKRWALAHLELDAWVLVRLASRDIRPAPLLRPQ